MLTYPQSALYQPVPVGRPPLRIGIMLDGTVVPAWVEQLLKDIQSSGFAELSLVILNANKPAQAAKPASRLKRLVTGQMKNALYSRYISYDESKHGHMVTALHPKEIAPLIEGVPRLPVQSSRTKFVDRFSDSDVQQIKAHGLDVMLRFGFNIIKGEILSCAKYGVWSYHHGDNNEYRGGPALFWEMHERNSVSGTILQRLTEALDGGEVIYRSYSSTEDKTWLSGNRHRTYWKTTAFVWRCLRSLYILGEEGIAPEPAKPYNKSIYRMPTNGQMLPFLARAAVNILAAKTRSMREQWLIAYRSRVPQNDPTPSTDGFIELKPPSDRFYADPFPIRVQDKDYIFFEDLEYKTNKGTIAFIEFDENGNASSPKLALETDVHLSYPFLFEWNDEIFMIPETAQNRTVTLFRAASFPDKWERVGDLLEGMNVADATLINHEGTWYMFAGVSEHGGSTCDELFLFYADSPLGPWHPHACNPVKSDVRSSRPAGNIFSHDGRLIRPAQDCAATYGHAIQFCEILKLNRKEYEERIVGRIDPDWMRALTGTHTYNRSDSIEVIDAKRNVKY